MSKTRVEQAAEYLRTKGHKVELSCRSRRPYTVIHPQGFYFHFGGQKMIEFAEEAGWGGETVSGNGATFHVKEGDNG